MEGFTRVEVDKIVWEFPDSYQLVSFLGGGSFGRVAKVRIRGTKEYFALKMRPLESEEDAKGAYREIRLLKHMDHRNITCLLNVFHPPAVGMAFRQVYLVTHLMDEDLQVYSRSRRMREHEIRPILYQILRGLKCMHSAGVVHRDLMPCNIAINANNEVRILDFGLSRRYAEITRPKDFVGTLWYWAPELLFLRGQNTKAIDMWSVGCILAELISGRVLFPGEHYFHQLECLLDVMGTPTEEFVSGIGLERSRKYVKKCPSRERCDFHHLFPGANIQAVDLMEKMLEMKPERRITASDAMRHPYLRDFIQPHHIYEDVAPTYDQNFENLILPVNGWKELIHNEIQNFKRK
ncbi:putative mitogen-activated protein kinase 14C [Drosophila yakuba]|uniref:mitogen-activated protein kinase n=1 Tax=Drosophila yakuba TaxID=7245 RepID=B4PL12_DROYA|nr:putative mitogen-activated protein kinase 14C [Drosophila yakuba]EDW98997.1 uncharacterized protein Dyak_GE10825 [Drosophila yakuba]